MTGTGVVLRLAGIGLFSACLAVLIRWEIKTWLRPDPAIERRSSWLLVITYLAMCMLAYLIFRVES